MAVNEKELLSALIDDELTGQELKQALALIENDDLARQQWLRYQFNRDVVHGNATPFSVDISKAVAMALDNEVVHKAKTTSKVISLPQHFWKQTISLAMAASIGALAVVGLISQPQQAIPTTVPVNIVEQTVTPQITLAGSENKSNRWTVGEPEVENRLNDYLVDHHEYVGTSGVFSYARVVAYEAGQ
jgi:sigma-E factor negative regulatory protein RseA